MVYVVMFLSQLVYVVIFLSPLAVLLGSVQTRILPRLKEPRNPTQEKCLKGHYSQCMEVVSDLNAFSIMMLFSEISLKTPKTDY